MRVYDFISGRIFSKLLRHHHLRKNAICSAIPTGTEVDLSKAARVSPVHKIAADRIASDIKDSLLFCFEHGRNAPVLIFCPRISG